VWIFALVGCLVLVPVLVAVVGILAAIAIPNFLKFQCKSKQSEAKTNLAGIWVAEKSFYGEYGFYTTDLKALNWSPDGAPAYLYGFAEEGPDRLPGEATPPSDYDPSRKDTSDPTVIGGLYSTVKMRDVNGSPLTGADLPADAVVTESGFTAAAIGDVDTDSSYGGASLDVWTIDEVRMLRVVDNDCSH
jgi:type II secretory pathway pseudopilin PulG